VGLEELPEMLKAGVGRVELVALAALVELAHSLVEERYYSGWISLKF
jgi:hypothetical protein